MKASKGKSPKRSVVSITLFITFILLPLTGKMIQLVERGSDWEHVWVATHMLIGFVFTGFGIFHIIYNWSALKHYMKGKPKSE
ncbi:hypothetical protein Barb6XT_00656 [Bacteroidales bacterium Barb6XT]|nr:hypothetical protein Barb6XT_00656 [Bacteroidales bacterium Barb6XT]